MTRRVCSYLILMNIVVLVIDPFVTAERVTKVGEELGLYRTYCNPAPICSFVIAVTRVTTTQYIVSRRYRCAGGEALVNRERHEP